MANEKVVIGAELKLESAQSLESVGKVKQAFKEAQKALHAAQEEFGEFSAEAIRAARYVAELKDRIGDANSLVDAFNPDRKFEAFSQGLNAVTGGFSAVQGAMGLLGVESEETGKMLLKVQSAMALSQGINSILEAKDTFKILATNIQNSNVFLRVNDALNKLSAASMKLFGISVNTTSIAFKGLKAAIAATGVGLLIVAIGELVSWFQKLSDAAEEAAEAEKEALEQKEKLAKVGLDGEIDFTNRQEQINIARAKLTGKSEEELFQIQQQYQRDRIGSYKRYLEEVGTEGEKGVEAEKMLKDAQLKLEVDSLNFQAEQNKKRLDEQKQANDKEKQLTEQRLKQQRQQHEQEIAEAKRLNSELEKENEIGRGDTEQEKELIRLQQEYDAKKSVLIAGEQTLVELELWFTKQKNDIQQKAYDEQQQRQREALEQKIALDKEAEEKRLEFHKETIDKIVSASQQLAVDETMSADSRRMSLNIAEQSILTDTAYTEEERTRILQAYSEARKTIDELEAQHKQQTANDVMSIADSATELLGRNTATGKAIAVASTTVSTYEAAQKAYASQMTIADPSAPVRAAIAAAAAIASGLVRVKGILSVKIPGQSGGGSANLTSISAPISPSLPSTQKTSLDSDTINAIGNQAIKTFVVETDVTNNQEKIARINRAARIG